jgi:quinol monooxygenase YgiN
MVRVNVALNAASPRDAERLADAFRFLMMSTRMASGCVECTVWVESNAIVHYTEAWETEDDLRRRVCSEQFTSLLSVVEAASDARVQFDFVIETRGLDYVAEVRAEVPDAGSRSS